MSKKVHFIAIGGSIMHNLAIALHQKGYQVTGSDDQIFSPSKERLDQHNLLPTQMGWDAHKITADLDEIVLGMHAKQDNPELLKAKELGLKIFSFPEYIYNESKNKQRICICGSHGKTTITSMVMHVLNYWKRPFDYAVGAQLDGFETMVKLDDNSPFIIIEGDEYLSSPTDLTPKFLRYQHHICSISGIAWDHVNVFPTFDHYVEQFEKLCQATPRSGTIIYNEEDKLVKKIAKATEGDLVKFSYKTPSFKIKNGITTVRIGDLKVELEIFGEHNLSNLACAHTICSRLSVNDRQFAEAIKTYKGANKRLDLVTKNEETNIYLDFAHAPSKVKATVQAVKEQFSKRKLITVLELHTFSSLDTKFISEYKDTLKLSDFPYVFIDPKVLAKKGLGEISQAQIKGFFKNPKIRLLTSSDELKTQLSALDLSSKNVLFMSSGNFDGLDIAQFSSELIHS